MKKIGLLAVGFLLLAVGCGGAWAGTLEQDATSLNKNNTVAAEVSFATCSKWLEPSFPTDSNIRLSSRYAYTWLSYVVPASVSTSQNFYEQDIEKSKQYFTEKGWVEFSRFLADIKFKDFLFTHNNTASIFGFLVTAPRMSDWKQMEGEVVGYVSFFKVILQLTFFESGQLTERTFPLRVSIVASAGDQNPKIDQWIVEEEKK